jgi:hydroxymethylpyrimidine/phosphomethylpyrimidine kinase
VIEEPAKVLTIGGSDSGGAAGLQADLKTWSALRVYGMSVVTAVTAQNSVEVAVVEYLPPELVTAQLETVLSDYGAVALKTGFIGRRNLIEAISAAIQRYHPQHVVIDPVLVNHEGQFMFNEDLLTAYRDHLLPLATLVTPNWREALLLAGLAVEASFDAPTRQHCMGQLHACGVRNVLITGHVQGEQICDFWSDGRENKTFATPLVATANNHGSGDTLSAAICANLAKGLTIVQAIQEARRFTIQALKNSASWRLGAGHGPLSHFI